MLMSLSLCRNVHVAYPQLGFGKLLHLAGDQGLRSCVNEVSSKFATIVIAMITYDTLLDDRHAR
jgi:hypothetical protein